MKFNLNTDKIEDLKLTFSDLEYEKDIADIIADFSYGMGLFVDFAVKLNCNTEQARVLKDVVISCLGRNIDDFLDRDVLNHDDETAEQSEEQTLYDKMVEMYAEWLENECSYDDEDKLIQDIKQYGVMPCMLYNDDEDTIDIYLEPDDDHFFCSFSELLGSMPAELFEDNQTRAEATVLAFELIATVLFDRAYGEDGNPLRADDFIHLDKQLPSFYETSNQNTVDIDAFNTVRDVIIKQTGTSPENVLTTSKLSDFDGFDSLTLVEIIMAIEEEFDVVIPDDAAQSINSVGDILDYLKNV